MNLIYKQRLEEDKIKLRNQLIQAEWNCYNELAENIRKKIKKVDLELNKL